MSDPMASVEIEDVLSSIRRLVSEDQRAPQRREAMRALPDTPPVAPPAAADGKLVLGPQLRVPADVPSISPSRISAELAHMQDDESDFFDFDAAEAAAMAEADRRVLSAPAEEVPEAAFIEAEEDIPTAEVTTLSRLAIIRPSQPEPAVVALDMAEQPEAAVGDEARAADAGLPDTVFPEPDLTETVIRDHARLASLEATIAELEAAVSGNGGWEPDGSEVIPDTAALREMAAVFAEEAETGADEAPEPDSDRAHDDLTDDMFTQGGVESRAGEAGQAAARPDTDLAQAGLDHVPAAPTEPAPAAVPPRRLHFAVPDDLPEDRQDEAERQAPEAAGFTHVASTVATGFAIHRPAVEDDRPEGQRPQSEAHAAMTEEQAAEDDADDEPTESLFYDDEDAIIDEAMLRDLVSEIIRQELQGTLGERITRNVRKLVRREIQRVLASRDFD